MIASHYSLADLEKKTGTRAGTIRSYIVSGLLPRPDAVGRNASYGHRHFITLRAIRVLRDKDKIGLDEVRRRLLTMTTLDEVAAVASRFPEPDPVTTEAADLESAVSAADYVRALRTWLKENAAGIASTNLSPPPPGNLAVSPATARDKTGAQAPSENIVRIPVASDVDLLVRGVPGKNRLAKIERAARELRHMLGRADNDDR